MTRIKMCGLRSEADIDYANRVRPEFVGFVFVPGSKRYITYRAAAALHSSLNEFLKVNRIRILSCARRSLQDHGGLELSCCLGDRLNDLHVVDIECTYCIAAAISFLKHFSCCY